jgi:hypothetical protein
MMVTITAATRSLTKVARSYWRPQERMGKNDAIDARLGRDMRMA